MFALVSKDAPSCERLARFRSSLLARFAEHRCDFERCLPMMCTVSFNTEVDKPFTVISIEPRRALCRLRSRVRSDWELLHQSWAPGNNVMEVQAGSPGYKSPCGQVAFPAQKPAGVGVVQQPIHVHVAVPGTSGVW